MFSENHPEDAKIENFNGRYELMNPDRSHTVELDMGCGTGSFTVQLARTFPERTVLAADVMIGRLRKVVKKATRMEAENMRFLRAEARFLLGIMMPDASLDRVHLLCPDPWPKDRHRGHRLVTADFTVHLHRVLKKGGIFHFSSDDVPYFDSVSRIIRSCSFFVPAPEEKIAEVSGIKSDFELRWLECGKEVRHLHVMRRD